MTKTDLTYTTNGFYISLLANTDAGVSAFNEIAKTFERGVLPAHMLPSLKAQLKNAGYTIRKARKKKPPSLSEIKDLLNELGA